jgi:hypothetical protein
MYKMCDTGRCNVLYYALALRKRLLRPYSRVQLGEAQFHVGVKDKQRLIHHIGNVGSASPEKI